MMEQHRMFHLLTAEETIQALGTNASSGLDQKEARVRMKKYGKNSLFFVKKKSILSCISEFASDPSLLLCFLVSCIAACFSRFQIALTVCLIILLSVGISAFFAIQSIRQREKNVRYAIPMAKVLRGGSVSVTEAWNLVPGDLILLSEGDLIPADARLLRTDRLMVSTRSLTNGELILNPPIEKNADPLQENSCSLAPFRDNMVYGGSEVVSGEAVAVVTEIGAHTYLAASGGAKEISRLDVPKSVQSTETQSRKYGIVLLILVIPLTAIGVWRTPGADFLDLFLLTLSLAAAAMSGGVAAYSALIYRNAVEQAEHPQLTQKNKKSQYSERKKMMQEDGDAVVFQNLSCMDSLRTLDELVVVGSSAIHDGKLHVIAVYADGHLMKEEELSEETADPILRSAYQFFRGYYASPVSECSQLQLRQAYYDGIKELLQLAHIDTDEIRKITGFPVFSRSESSLDFGKVTVQTGDGAIVYHLSMSPDCALKCDSIRQEGMIFSMSGYFRTQLLAAAKEYQERHSEILYFYTEEHGHLVFEGFLAFSPLLVRNLPDLCAHLKDCRLKVSMFVSNRGNDFYYANEAGFSGEIYCVSDPAKEASLYCRQQGKDGKRVGVFSVENVTHDLLKKADVSISCCRIQSDAEEGRRRSYESVRNDGMPDSEFCTESVRAEVDLLIPRVNSRGGGLSAFLCAYHASVFAHRRVCAMLAYLTDTQFFRMAMILASLLTGQHIVSAPIVLFSGLIFDLFAVLLIANSKPSRYPSKIGSETADVLLISSLSGVGLFFISMIPTYAGWTTSISGQGCYLFLSVFLVQIVAFLYRYRMFCGSFRTNALSGGFLLTFCTAVVRCVTLEPVARFLGIDGMNLIRCAFLPAAPILYLLFTHGYTVLHRKSS